MTKLCNHLKVRIVGFLAYIFLNSQKWLTKTTLMINSCHVFPDSISHAPLRENSRHQIKQCSDCVHATRSLKTELGYLYDIGGQKCFNLESGIISEVNGHVFLMPHEHVRHHSEVPFQTWHALEMFRTFHFVTWSHMWLAGICRIMHSQYMHSVWFNSLTYVYICTVSQKESDKM